MNEVEFYGADGKVGYSIFDGEVFSEEDYDSLVEQGAFDDDDDDDKSEIAHSLIQNILNGVTPQRKPPNPPKNRKGRRKIANLSRKINRSK